MKTLRRDHQTEFIHWSLWYFLFTTILLWLLGTRYLITILPLELPFEKTAATLMVYGFLMISYISHIALLAFLVWLFFVFPFVYCFPKRIIVFPIAVASATLLTFFMLVDSHIYQQYRFHLNQTIFTLLLGGEAQDVFGFNLSEWLTGLSSISIILSAEMGLAYLTWITFKRLKHGKKIIITLLSLMCLSYYCVIISTAQNQYHFIQQTIALPYYKNVLLKLLPIDILLTHIEEVNQDKFTQPRQVTAPLKYPLNPLTCIPEKHPYNIVLLVIDTWRFNTLKERITPHLKTFSKQSWYFTNHFSGGNGTQAGMFSLFYSLPNSYWTTMIDQNKGPLLLKTMLQHHYQTNILWSGQLTVPAFDKTIFQDIPQLEKKSPKGTAVQNDQYVTDKALDFLEHYDPKRPFFLFTMYLTAHNYCVANDFPTPIKPSIKQCNRLTINASTDPTPYMNRYFNALTFVDEQIGRVLDALQAKHLYDKTIVIITGDHGEEFNDSHNNYWFHASNFSDFQLKTPLLIKWPKTAAHQWHHFTSHYDLAPMLLQKALHCSNPIEDYGLGQDLLDPHKKNYFLASSYVNYGIITADKINILYPDGDFIVQDRQANPIRGAQPQPNLIKEALGEMRKFYAK